MNFIKKNLYKLLKISEKYTKTDMIYLFKGSFWLSARQVIFSICAFITAIAFARFLPKEIYGQYKYILSIAGILAITTLSRIDTGVILSTANGLEGIVKKAFKIRIKWGIIGLIASIVLAIYFYINNNILFALCFLIISVFIPIMDSSQVYLAYLNGKKIFDIHAKYNAIIRIIATIILISVIFLTNNLILIILTYFLVYTILRLFFLNRTLKKFPPNKKQDPKYIRYGKELSFLRIVVEISSYLDKILIFKYLGAVQLAIYAFAIAPVNQINTILQSVRVIALPKFSTGKEQEIKKTLPKKIIKAMFIVIIIVITYIIFAPYIYKIFFPQYLESISYSRLFSISLILFPMTFIPGYFSAKIKKKKIYSLTLSAPIIRITLLLILTPIYGIIGVISANIITNLANALLSIIFLKLNL